MLMWSTINHTSAVTYAVEFSRPCFCSQCGHTKAKAPSENNFAKQNVDMNIANLLIRNNKLLNLGFYLYRKSTNYIRKFTL